MTANFEETPPRKVQTKDLTMQKKFSIPRINLQSSPNTSINDDVFKTPRHKEMSGFYTPHLSARKMRDYYGSDYQFTLDDLKVEGVTNEMIESQKELIKNEYNLLDPQGEGHFLLSTAQAFFENQLLDRIDQLTTKKEAKLKIAPKKEAMVNRIFDNTVKNLTRQIQLKLKLLERLSYRDDDLTQERKKNRKLKDWKNSPRPKTVIPSMDQEINVEMIKSESVPTPRAIKTPSGTTNFTQLFDKETIEKEPKISKEAFIHASVRRWVISQKRQQSGILTPRRNGSSFSRQMSSLRSNLNTFQQECFTPRPRTRTRSKSCITPSSPNSPIIPQSIELH